MVHALALSLAQPFADRGLILPRIGGEDRPAIGLWLRHLTGLFHSWGKKSSRSVSLFRRAKPVLPTGLGFRPLGAAALYRICIARLDGAAQCSVLSARYSHFPC